MGHHVFEQTFGIHGWLLKLGSTTRQTHDEVIRSRVDKVFNTARCFRIINTALTILYTTFWNEKIVRITI